MMARRGTRQTNSEQESNVSNPAVFIPKRTQAKRKKKARMIKRKEKPTSAAPGQGSSSARGQPGQLVGNSLQSSSPGNSNGTHESDRLSIDWRLHACRLAGRQ